MSINRQRTANYEGDCNECFKYIGQDDPVWFDSNGKMLDTTCAAKAEIICPNCNGSKKPTFNICFECAKGPAKPTKASLI